MQKFTTTRRNLLLATGVILSTSAAHAVHDSRDALGTHSELLTALVSRGELAIVGAMHDVRTGVASWLS